jgi:hypothetical protein
MDLDHRLASLASRQRGLITKAQARELGATKSQLKWRTRSGALAVVRPGVYAFPGVPSSWEQLVQAAVLSAGTGVVASHETALRLFGGAARALDVIDLSSHRPRRIDVKGVRSHRSLVLFDADVSTRRGIATTSPARTVVDLSGSRSTSELGRTVDDFLRRRLVRLPQVAQAAHRLRVAPGRSLATVHSVLQERWEGYDPGDSDLESRVLRVLHAAGLPLPRQQVRVMIGGRRCYIDLAYVDLMLAIEIDSWAYHRFRSAFNGDRAKSNELTVLGWHVYRVYDAMSDAEIIDLVVRARSAMGEIGAA